MNEVGIDIEEVNRFKRLLIIKPELVKKIFTQYEWEYASQKNTAQSLAGIWCAKEAVVKALSALNLDIAITDVFIGHRKNGVPIVLKINNVNIDSQKIKLSISHTKVNAIAIAIFEKDI